MLVSMLTAVQGFKDGSEYGERYRFGYISRLEFTALLVQPQYWKDSQPPGKIEGWRGWKLRRLEGSQFVHK